MTHVIELPSQKPCDGDGVCMLCKAKPSAEETLTCKTCAAPWHADCLAEPSRPDSLASTVQWDCPDCSGNAPTAPTVKSSGLISEIRAIMADESLTDIDKAKRRQELMTGKSEEPEKKDPKKMGSSETVDEIFKCASCWQLLEKPVTTPCGHNTCLLCFLKWVREEREPACITCRRKLPKRMVVKPRINSSLVVAIRNLSNSDATRGPAKVCHYVQNQDRPDKAYTTERAKRPGKANAASGKRFVTAPEDHFGPILAEHDPQRNQGVMVGENWEDRHECRQWGVHGHHVSGIVGQSKHGAQSVVLSGGYQDDEDHGEWFLYTGSGGRDLNGNKRTNKVQSTDQEFVGANMALQVSCLNGYPVRVVRSHKEKRSSYAPVIRLRYDGVYRVEKCWIKVGVQGFKVCRYLFVRCDNEPAPWTSDEHGDRPRELPLIPELENATNIIERKASPSWDFEEKEGCWKWIKTPPNSKKSVQTLDPANRKRSRKDYSCLICGQMMKLPVTTPCAHNFCKLCFEGVFPNKSLLIERNKGGRSLRTLRNVFRCPSCCTDVSDFVQDPKVNIEMNEAIKLLTEKNKDDKEENKDDNEENKDDNEENEEEEEENEEEEEEEENEDEEEESMDDASTQMSEEADVIDGEQTSTECKVKGISPKRQKVKGKSDIVEEK